MRRFKFLVFSLKYIIRFDKSFYFSYYLITKIQILLKEIYKNEYETHQGAEICELFFI